MKDDKNIKFTIVFIIFNNSEKVFVFFFFNQGPSSHVT